ENTRLFEVAQARTRELQEALEYQTAISNVLGVISRSPNDLHSVLDTIVETAVHLCKTNRAAFWLLRDGKFQYGATSSRHRSQSAGSMKQNPPATGPSSMSGRTVLEKRTLHVEDRQKDFNHPANEVARTLKTRSMLTVPLMRKDEPIGVLALTRDEV